MTGNKKGKSLFYSYAVSYMVIFFMTFVIVGALLLDYYVKDLIQSYQQMIEYKVSMVEEELNTQLEIANKVRYNIGTTATYNPVYFKDSVTRKRQLIQQLTLFQGNSIFMMDYCLLYPDREEAYSTEMGTSQLLITFEKIWEVQDFQEVLKQLKNLETVTVMNVEENKLWFCFPIRLHTSGEDSNAVLLCKVDQQNLLTYVTKRTGTFENKVAIFYSGQLLIETPDFQTDIDKREIKEGFQITYEFSPVNYLGNISVLQSANIILILAAGVILLGVAFHMAYYHSKKIRNVSQMISSKLVAPKVLEGNELNHIEEMFSLVYQQNENYIKQLQTQLQLLKQHLIYSLVTGEWEEKMEEQLELLHMDLADKQLAVMRIHEYVCSEKEQEAIVADIELLSDDTVQYYAAHDARKKEIVVIMALNAEDDWQEAIDLVRELLSVYNFNAPISAGTVYGEITQVANSYLESFRYEDNGAKKTGNYPPEILYDNSYVDKMEMSIIAGNFADAHMCLKKLIEQTARNDSLLVQQCVYSDMLSMLMRTASKQHVVFSSQQISNMMISQKLSNFFANADEMIQILCETACEAQKSEENTTMYAVKKFVQEHFLDNDLSIEKLAEEYNISVTYLSRAFKRIAGKNYKEFVIQLKVEYAMERLRQGMTVAEVSEEVGYANVSHFIKVFKKQVGITPAVYKKNSSTEE